MKQRHTLKKCVSADALREDQVRHKEIGTRIGTARRDLGISVEDLSVTTGIPVSTLKKYEAGNSTPGGEAIESLVRAGINANWLVTGEGPIWLADLGRPSGGGRSVGPALDRIEAVLYGLDQVPLDQQTLANRPDLQAIRQELKEIFNDQGVIEKDRARADVMLGLAFGERDADARMSERLKVVGERLRRYRQSYEEGAKAAGYAPPEIVRETLHMITFEYGLSAEAVKLVLEALRKAYGK